MLTSKVNSFLIKILGIQFIGISLNVFFYYSESFYRQKGWPYITPLFSPYDLVQGVTKGPFGTHLFGDFWVTYLMTTSPSPYLNPMQGFFSNYFPATHLLLKPFTFFEYTTAVYLFFSICLLTNVVVVLDVLKKFAWFERGVFCLLIAIFNYAVYFALDRGNIEILVLSFLFLFLQAFVKEKYKLAGFFLGLATAIKLFPGFFLLLLIKKKEKKGIFVFLLTGFLVSLVALATFSGGIWANLIGLIDCLRNFSTGGGRPGLQYASSYFTLFKTLYYYLHDSPHPFLFYLSYPFKWIAEIRTLVAIGSLIFFLKKVIKTSPPIWLECFIYAGLLILLPKTSFDYRLCYLLLPLLLMIRETQEKAEQFALMEKLGVVLSLVLLPKTFYILLTGTGYAIGLSTLLNPALLMLGLYFVAKNKIPH